MGLLEGVIPAISIVSGTLFLMPALLYLIPFAAIFLFLSGAPSEAASMESAETVKPAVQYAVMKINTFDEIASEAAPPRNDRIEGITIPYFETAAGQALLLTDDHAVYWLSSEQPGNLYFMLSRQSSALSPPQTATQATVPAAEPKTQTLESNAARGRAPPDRWSR
ncbi:MAG: hypothetical protein HYT79_04670 [Elusimicrobia bacterium]|nr:hypothetical protein [Elusimicrobiota bacterium]